MLIYYAVGRLGVQLAQEASRSALPDAPVMRDDGPRPAMFRVRTADALHRLADRIGPVEAQACAAQTIGLNAGSLSTTH